MIGELYERYKAYKLNPCDTWAFGVLKPFGRALERFSSPCPCCNGARTLAAAAAGALFPLATGIVLGVLYMAFLTIEVWAPTGDDE